ncbi:hypothetical protein B0H14DRAFT_1130115 [Mycena olivaceomarginata]|nr:hypothetical protein B0H14DRAFT_1130115 [Mycena olivaceomarginata]
MRSMRRWRSPPPTSPRHLPARRELFSSVLRSPLDTCTYRTPRYHPHHLARTMITGAAFIASSRAKRVSSKYHSPHPHARRAHPQHGMHHHPRAQHLRQPLPVTRATAITSPPVASFTILRSKLAPVRYRGCDLSIVRARSKCNVCFPSPTTALIPCPRIAPILCGHAGLYSKP